MTQIHIINWETFSKKFSQYIALGLAGSLIWFGANEANRRIERYGLEKKILEQKKESTSLVDDAIVDWNADGAFRLINDLRDDGIYTQKELMDMKRKAKMVTEDGFYDKIKSAPIEERVKLDEKYLKVYPSGEHRKEVIEDMLISSASILSDGLQELGEFDKVSLQLRNFTSSFEKYASEGINLDSIPRDIIIAQGEEYLGQVEIDDKSQKKPDFGTKVKVVYAEKTSFSWKQEYLTERTRLIPVGSKGTIIGIGSYGKHFVEFPKMPKITWKQDWEGIENYKGRNVAMYAIEELFFFPTTNEISKHYFRSELNKLKNCNPKKGKNG